MSLKWVHRKILARPVLVHRFVRRPLAERNFLFLSRLDYLGTMRRHHVQTTRFAPDPPSEQLAKVSSGSRSFAEGSLRTPFSGLRPNLFLGVREIDRGENLADRLELVPIITLS